eukprot:613363-Pelagomonas_calceolata.AAC.5
MRQWRSTVAGGLAGQTHHLDGISIQRPRAREMPQLPAAEALVAVAQEHWSPRPWCWILGPFVGQGCLKIPLTGPGPKPGAAASCGHCGLLQTEAGRLGRA